MKGGLSVTNDSESLLKAESGEVIALAEANTIANEFDSVVFPVMPAGLGLELNNSNGNLCFRRANKMAEKTASENEDRFASEVNTDPL